MPPRTRAWRGSEPWPAPSKTHPSTPLPRPSQTRPGLSSRPCMPHRPRGHKDVSDWLGAGGTLEELQGLTSIQPVLRIFRGWFVTLLFRLPNMAQPSLQFHGQRAFYLSRSEEHTSELQSLRHLVCRLLL